MLEKLPSISQSDRLDVAEGISYYADFLDAADASKLQRVLSREAVWRTEQIHMFGRSVVVPRLVSWCGEDGVSYRYSGRDHPAQGWFTGLDVLAGLLSSRLRQTFNFALLNRYRCGSDHMGWHTDDEPAVSGLVASLSLGADRHLLLRSAGSARSLRLLLEHGSLLVFDPSIRHCLPRRKQSDERINVTFRSIGSQRVPR